MALLDIENLRVGFDTEAGFVHAVDGVSLSMNGRRTLGLVGESGCGKSVTATSILRLVPNPPGKITAGAVLFEGVDILKLPSSALPNIRGKEIAMIFQDPMTSLNPVFTIGKQLGEILRLRGHASEASIRARSMEMLATVGIPDAASRLNNYPHELSGGMKQRVMIGFALLAEPKILIADEPTTALDVTIQAQILTLIRALQQKTGCAVLFITHDMGVVAEMCDDVAVMYAGRVVEQGSADEIFKRSQHPYTKGLLRSLPQKGMTRKMELPTIEGVVPSLLKPPPGCRFAERCWKRKRLDGTDQKTCFDVDPFLRPLGSGLVACHFPVAGEEP